MSTTDWGLPNEPLAAAGPPVTTATQSAPLTGTPFVPALSGHRLAFSGDVAIVSDPEGPNEDGTQPQVHLASLSQKQLLASLNLPVGSNPEAVAVASDGYAYVVAAGLGGVIAVDVAHRKLGAFTATCPAPVDLATRGTDVLVACRGGEVVTLTSGAKEVTLLPQQLARIAVDQNARVYVATTAAEIIEVGVAPAVAPETVALTGGGRVAHANTPRRLLPMPGGGVFMQFQQSLSGELTEQGTPVQYYGGGGPTCPMPATRPSTSTYDTDGRAGFSSLRWTPSTLIIDAAISKSGKTLVQADAAGAAIRFQNAAPVIGSNNSCSSTDPVRPDSSDLSVAAIAVPVAMPSAVGFAGDTLVVLNHEPLELQLIPPTLPLQEGEPVPAANKITLRDRHVSEGFRVFHTDPTAVVGDVHPHAQSVACGSCHPEGLSNGATTEILGTVHRVMPLAGHLENATLIHWNGQSFHEAVVQSTWHDGMGGEIFDPTVEGSLYGFLRQLKMPARAPANAGELALGKDAFAQAGCGQCHDPLHGFTNDQMADVGHGNHKVPSLVGLVYTAPYMSDGCAATLEDRFSNAACGGGDHHGTTSTLSPAQVTALVSYLKTL